jgi:hypothetical protein
MVVEATFRLGVNVLKLDAPWGKFGKLPDSMGPKDCAQQAEAMKCPRSRS